MYLSTSLHAKITASGGSPDFAMLSDGDLEKTTKLPIPAVGEILVDSIRVRQRRQTIRVHYLCRRWTPDRMTTALFGIGAPEKTLEASDDGKNFQPVAESAWTARSGGHGFIPGGHGEVFPRHLQADAATASPVGLTPRSCAEIERRPPTTRSPNWRSIQEPASIALRKKQPSSQIRISTSWPRPLSAPRTPSQRPTSSI